MHQFIRDHCLRADSMPLATLLRAMRARGIDLPRTEVVAALSREFKLAEVHNQTWVVGLSLRNSKANKLREFIDTNCICADGLTCKLAAVVRGSGLPRTRVIQQLQEWGFEIAREGYYVVHGIGLREPVYS